MDIINSNEDILFTILCNLSSYKRSKVCTVCGLWNATIGRVISLIENSLGLQDMFKHQCYHSIIRLLKQTYIGRWVNRDDGTFGIYKRAVEHHMFWTTNTPVFAKLWLDINNNQISWSSDDVFAVANRGYDKLFRWMQKSSHLRLQVWETSTQTYNRASLRLAIVLKNPDLITKENVPKSTYDVKRDIFDTELDAHCLDKVLSLANFTIFHMMDGISSGGFKGVYGHLMGLLMDKILRDFPADVEYDNYQDILDQYYPNVIVYEGDIDDFINVEFDSHGQNLRGCIIPELIEVCRSYNYDIHDKLYKMYKTVHYGYSEARYDMLVFYCGIMASNYNENVVNILNDNLFDTIAILEAACRYRHKKMIHIIVEFIRNDCGIVDVRTSH